MDAIRKIVRKLKTLPYIGGIISDYIYKLTNSKGTLKAAVIITPFLIVFAFNGLFSFLGVAACYYWLYIEIKR